MLSKSQIKEKEKIEQSLKRDIGVYLKSERGLMRIDFGSGESLDRLNGVDQMGKKVAKLWMDKRGGIPKVRRAGKRKRIK